MEEAVMYEERKAGRYMAVKSAERVFRIFELLEQSPEGLTNKEVSSLLGFAPSSTLALLQTMEENGYLAADE